MIRRNKILDLFKAQSIEFMDSQYESKIGFRIAFIQFILFLISETISAVFEVIYSAEIFSFSKFITYFILYFSNLITITSIISLIAYQIKIISKQIDNFYENFSVKNLPEIYRFISRTNRFVKKFDYLISSVIFMNIINSSIIVSHICV
jgi:hypothetical protein